MAEAIVEERPAMSNSRYYCHMCNVEINAPNENYTCPLCAGGFIEELPAPAPAPPPPPSVNAPGAGTSRSNTNLAVNPQRQAGTNRLSNADAIRGEIATLLMDRYGPNIEISVDPTTRRIESHGVIPHSGPRNNQLLRRNFGPNVLIDFLNSLDTNFGNTSMVYLGNIGDYAWGREGIDTIVTQLLNQMETAGPPPLPKEKIDEIPKVQVTQEDVDNKTQCSVCWEDFVLNETVRKLPCLHIYHENCIVPWLDLHGTCPICRKSLTNNEENGGSDGGANGSGPPHGNNGPRSDGSFGGGGGAGGRRSTQRFGDVGMREQTTMRNNALDDLD